MLIKITPIMIIKEATLTRSLLLIITFYIFYSASRRLDYTDRHPLTHSHTCTGNNPNILQIFEKYHNNYSIGPFDTTSPTTL